MRKMYNSPKPRRPETVHIVLNIFSDHIYIATAMEANTPTGTTPGQSIHPSLAGKHLIVSSLEYTIEEFRARREFKECSLWKTITEDNHVLLGVFNTFAHTFSAKAHPGVTASMMGQWSYVQILVPFSDSTFEDMHYIALSPRPDAKLISNVVFERMQELHMEEDILAHLPTLAISGPVQMLPDTTITLNCVSSYLQQPTDHQLQVYLENFNGYLPVTRFTMRGQHQFKASSQGLAPGEEITVKAGFRYRSAVAAHTIQIVASL